MIGNKKVLAVILARKGSKGIPGKNYRELLGKPLFWWSVDAAAQSKYIDTIVISSNCERCEEEYVKWITDEQMTEKHVNSIIWIDRPEEISGDLSKNEDALIHALNSFESREYDIVVNLQVTSPCRLDGLVDKCIEEYDKGGYDSLLTGSKDTPFLWRKKDGKWTYPVDYNDCCDRKMRQEFKEAEFVYHDCGNIFMTDVNVLLDTGCRIGYNPCVFEVEGLNGLQIDTKFDFDLIESMAKVKKLESLI
jgi:CMP-N-acetylneuraminic acid synthetase